MKKVLTFIASLLFAIPLYADVTLSGTVTDTTGASVNNGTVVFKVMNCAFNPLKTADSSPVTAVSSFSLNSSGVLSGTIVGNDAITCGATSFYQAIATKNNGTLVWKRLYSITGGTFNVSTAPLLASLPALPSLLSNPMTTAGDLVIGGGGGQPVRLPLGANGTCLGVVTGSLTYTTCGSGGGGGGFTNPMTTLGDLMYGGASGTATRLAGNSTSAKQFLNQTGTGSVSAAPIWSTIGFSDLTGSASSAQIPNSVVYNNQANVFTAGSKQTITPSASTAGLRHSPVTADPSSLASGDMWYRSDLSNGRVRIRDSAGSPVTHSLMYTDDTLPGAQVTGNITGNAAGITGSLTLGNTPLTTYGDLLYVDATPALARLAGNITTTKKFLTETGSGAISSPPSWGTIAFVDITGAAAVKAQLPAVTVYTDAANTYTTGLQDFSGVSLRIPIAAGFTVTTNGQIGFDTTNKNYHAGINGADAILVSASPSAPINNDCAKWSVASGLIQLADLGVPCGTVTGSSLTSGQLIFGNGGSSIAPGNLSGDATTSGTTAVIVAKINGTTVPTNATADTVLQTTAAATSNWIAIPNCGDATHALAYNTTTHTWSCQAITGSASAGGANTQIQYNNVGALGGISNFTWTAATGVVNINQLANSNDSLIGKRATDTTPTGNFLKLINNAGTTTLYQVDVSGNETAASVTISSTGIAGISYIGQGTAQPLGTTAVGLTAPTAVTSYNIVFPGAAASGIGRYANSSNIVTMSISELSGDAVTSGSNAVTVSSTHITGGTNNTLSKFNGTGNLVNSALSDNGTIVSTTEHLDLTSKTLLSDVSNDTTTGTTNNLLAKITPTGAIKAGISDSNIPVFIVTSGGALSGSAQIAINGQATCTMDATTSSTEGFYVIASTGTAGQCHAQSAQPTGVFIIGTMISNSTTSGATATIQVAGGGGFNPSAGSGYSTIQSNGTAQTQRTSVNFISGTNATVSCVDNAGATKTDCTISASSTAGSRLDQISAAIATNTTANLNNQQNWNWSLTGATTIGFSFGETAAATGGTVDVQALIQIATSAGSTAIPLIIKNSLNGAQTLSAVLIVPTWNTTGVVDAALKINPTNTASGAGSLLIDAQLGNTSQFKVDKAGVVTATTSYSTTALSQGMLQLTASTTAPASFPANTMGWLAPNSATIATPFYFQPATSVGPAASGPMLVGTVTGNISAITYGTNSGNTSKYATSTGTLTTGDLASWDASGNIIDAAVIAANVTTNSVSGTTNAIPKFSGAHLITNSSILDDGTTVSISENLNTKANAQAIEVANSGTTGTTVNKLAKLTGAPSNAVIAATSDTDNIVGIVVGGAGTTSNAQIAVDGIASCVFDGATTAGNYVSISSTVAGDCHDAGAARPSSGQVLGRVLSTNGAGGTFAIAIFTGIIGGSGGGGSGYTTIQSNGTAQTQRTTVNFLSGTNATVSCVDNAGSTKTDCTISASSAAGSRLDQITAATLANSINNADNAQQFNWSLTTASKIGLLISENVASTGTSSVLLKSSTLSGSTASPFQMDSNGNGLKMDTTGKLAAVGTGSVDTASLSSKTGTGAAVLATGATNVTLDAEATGNAITRPLYTSYTPSCNSATPSSGAFNVPTSGAATFSCTGTTTTEGNADFVDASTTTLIAGPFTLPQGWTGNIDVRLVWWANLASANAVRWSVQLGCVADSSAINTGPGYNTASQSNTAYTGTANQRKTTTFTSVASSGTSTCAAGSSAYFLVQRIGADVGDTLAATAELLELQVELRATK